MSDTAVLIVAAGRGTRAGGDIPKQYRAIGGLPVLTLTLDRFLSHRSDLHVAVVVGADDAPHYARCAPQHLRLLPPISGGATRQESVRLGLARLALEEPRNVLIHDAVRPFVPPALIDRVIGALDSADAVVPATAVSDTLKRVSEERFVSGTVDRTGLMAAETPQGFRFDAIRDAHNAAAEAGLSFTDDAAVAEWAGLPVKVVPGDAGNVKLTTAADIVKAERRLAGDRALALGDVRVGSGYDTHAFTTGDHVMLGGIAVPHSFGVRAHSDGDVVLHALTDAILGALAEGDIGDHFPPSDPAWRNAPSERFLRFAVERVTARGGAISHLDVTIVTEAPRIGPHRGAMRERIAAICGVDIGRVAVKATTSEGLGFVGRSEGLVASATATIRLPWSDTV